MPSFFVLKNVGLPEAKVSYWAMLEQSDELNHNKLSDLDLTHLHSLQEQQKEISLKLAVRLISVVSGFDSRETRSKGSLS